MAQLFKRLHYKKNSNIKSLEIKIKITSQLLLFLSI